MRLISHNHWATAIATPNPTPSSPPHLFFFFFLTVESFINLFFSLLILFLYKVLFRFLSFRFVRPSHLSLVFLSSVAIASAHNWNAADPQTHTLTHTHTQHTHPYRSHLGHYHCSGIRLCWVVLWSCRRIQHRGGGDPLSGTSHAESGIVIGIL